MVWEKRVCICLFCVSLLLQLFVRVCDFEKHGEQEREEEK